MQTANELAVQTTVGLHSSIKYRTCYLLHAFEIFDNIQTFLLTFT